MLVASDYLTGEILSRLTIARTGNPGRMVMVGWMLRLRLTTCWPVWLRLSVVPRRTAVTTALSLLVAPSSAPTPSTVEWAAATASRPSARDQTQTGHSPLMRKNQESHVHGSWLRRSDRTHGEYSAPGTVTPNTRPPCEKLINDRACS